jgi:hypothetical protein
MIPKAEYVSTASGLGRSLLSRVQDLAGQQEELRQIREQVLINREKLSSAGKRVRHQREILGVAEAKLMDAFRERHNSVANSDSSEPTIPYTAVEDARNELVDLEDDLLHIQDALGAAEWELMDMETDLYQYDLQQLAGGDMGQDTLDSIREKSPTPIPPSVSMRTSITVAPSSITPPCTTTLLPTTIPLSTTIPSSTRIPLSTTIPSSTRIPSPTVIPPSIQVQYQIAITHHEQLLRQFDELRSSYNDMDQQIGSVTGIATDIAESSGILIWNIIESEIKARSLKAKLAPKEGPMMSQCYTKSDTGGIPKAEIHLSATTRSAFSDSAIRHISDHVSDKHFVSIWLLDCLKSSGMEKACFKSILEHELQLLNVTTLDVKCLAGYIKIIWPSNMVNLLNWPGQESSVSEHNGMVQTNPDDESGIASLRKKNGLELPITHQRAETSIEFAKTERETQWFISLPRSELMSLRFDDAAIFECIAAWVEGTDIEHIPARIELPEFEQSAIHNDVGNHLYSGDMSQQGLVFQPSTLARFLHNSSTRAEQSSNCNISVANFGQAGIESSELEYTSIDGSPVPGPHSLVGPLKEGFAIPNDDNTSTSDGKDGKDEKVCVSDVEYGRAELVRTPLLRVISSSYRYEQVSLSFVRVLLYVGMKLTTIFVLRNDNTSGSVKRSTQLSRVKAYASYKPPNTYFDDPLERTESRKRLATTYSRESLARLCSGHSYPEDLAHWTGSAKRLEQACFFHLPAAYHHATGLQTMTIYNPGDLDTAGTVCSHSLVI